MASTRRSSSPSPAPSRASACTSTRRTVTRRPSTPSTGSTPRRGRRPTSASWDEAIAALAAGIASHLYTAAACTWSTTSARATARTATADWLANVTLFVERLGGDPLDTRWTGGVPPLADTPLLELTDGYRLSTAPHVVGDLVEARFTIVNSGTAAIEVEDVRLAVRDAFGEAHDLIAGRSPALAPGEAREFSGSWILGSLGRWHGWVEVRGDGQRVLLESARVFALTARLPRDLELRRG